MPQNPVPGRVDVDDLIGRIGLRRTRATAAVLSFFVSHPNQSVTHADLEAGLADRGLTINRVTLYRLLDRLVAHQVLDKHPDDQSRHWRFSWRDGASDAALPRFECDACHRHFELPEASGPTRAVAEQLLSTLSSLGHVGQRVDLSIHGTCAGCNDPAH